ncbi:hypothetical protein FKP32DRAFT_536551 [Trametes sanguinea]|nr:hypothetical protein FKP32DRAFT_536551 [Trametes sanguinea]
MAKTKSLRGTKTKTQAHSAASAPLHLAAPSGPGASIKRELTASPDLSQPLAKKQKAYLLSGLSETAHDVFPDKLLSSVRHTRAHDGNPNPACLTCTQASGDSTRGQHVVFSFETIRSDPCSTPTTVMSGPGIPLSLKSALRVAPPSDPVSSSRPQRRVRFAHELYEEALAAYTRQSTSAGDSEAAHDNPGAPGLVLPRLPKRKRIAPAGSGAVQPDNDSTPGPLGSLARGLPLDSRPAGVCATSVNESATSATLPGIPHLSDPLSVAVAFSEPPVSLSHSRSVSGSKRRKLLHAASPTSVSISPPRTPSPHKPSGYQSRSFFSPSFFSPAHSSSSGEDEVEALLASSPPTSPALVPRSSPLCLVLSPVPLRPSVNFTMAHRVPSIVTKDVDGVVPASVGSPAPWGFRPPADIPPRTRTPPNSGPGPGSKPGTPQPARPSGPESDTDRLRVVTTSGSEREVPVPPRVCTPPGPPNGGSRPCTPQPGRPVRPSADSQDVGRAGRMEDGGEGMPLSLPFPPRARTPPGPPGGGSRPCTPEPGRPIRPADNVDSGAEDRVQSPAFGQEKMVHLACEADVEAPRQVSTSEAAVANLAPTISRNVKIEPHEEKTLSWTAGDVLCLGEDEDDEPLAVVLARRRVTTAVKVEAAEVKIEMKKKDAKKTSRRARKKGQETKEAGVQVKEEAIASNVIEQTQAVLVPQKKKRARKAKAPKQLKAEDEASVKTEPDTVATATTRRKQANRKPRKKGDLANAVKAGAASSQRQGTGSTANRGKKAEGKQHASASTQSTATQATVRPSINDQSDIIISLPSTTLKFRLSINRSSSRTLRRRISFQGPMHPPRTWTYLPEHLQALGSVVWDAEGFDRMEFSALPWIAGVAQQLDAPRDLAPGVGHESAFQPALPRCATPHVLVEDARVLLHADGPLPVSLSRVLERTLSMRREGGSALGQVGCVSKTEMKSGNV